MVLRNKVETGLRLRVWLGQKLSVVTGSFHNLLACNSHIYIYIYIYPHISDNCPSSCSHQDTQCWSKPAKCSCPVQTRTSFLALSYLPSWRYSCGGRPEGCVTGLCWLPAGPGWEAAGAGGPVTVWLVWGGVWPGWTGAWPGWMAAWPGWVPPWPGWATGLGWVWGLCFWVMGLCFSELGPDWEPVLDRRWDVISPVWKMINSVWREGFRTNWWGKRAMRCTRLHYCCRKALIICCLRWSSFITFDLVIMLIIRRL